MAHGIFEPIHALPIVFVLGIVFVISMVYLALKALICYLVAQSLKTVPPEYRQIEPSMVWLLMVPCFSIIWNFFVFRRVPQSFQNYSRALGIHDTGDCGQLLGTWYAGLCATGLIPWVPVITGPVALVLLVMSLVRYNDLSQRIARHPSAVNPPSTPSPIQPSTPTTPPPPPPTA